MKLPTHGRYDYVPITKRPVYDWPEGKRQREALWITTPGEIARYCETLPKGTVPGSDD
jgi:hypothetical protein